MTRRTGDAVEVLRDFLDDMASMTGKKPVMLGLPAPFYDLVHEVLGKQAKYRILPHGVTLELDGVALFAMDATPA